jgi:transposase InsO family protein
MIKKALQANIIYFYNLISNKAEKMRFKNKYDTFLIWMIVSGNQTLIPDDVIASIPASTLSTWRNNVEINSYVGHELSQIKKEALDSLYIRKNHQYLWSVLTVVKRVWLNLSRCVLPVINGNEDFTEMLFNEIQKMSTVIPLKQTLKYFKWTFGKYYSVLAQTKIKCSISPMLKCYKRQIHQLSINELKIIKRMFENPCFTVWPTVSKYHYAKRFEGLNIGKNTFYRYSKLLGYSSRIKKKSKKKNKIGIKSKSPNEYLHVDTTFWMLANGLKVPIVFVSDNYSKMILGWSISTKHGAENVKTALRNTIETIGAYHPKLNKSILVSDGGGENTSGKLLDWLEETKNPSITRITAQKDIRFSNSPVEAINKIVKKYLRLKPAETYEELEQQLQWIVEDYNKVRPQDSIGGLRPYEAYTQQTPNSDKILSKNPDYSSEHLLRLETTSK